MTLRNSKNIIEARTKQEEFIKLNLKLRYIDKNICTKKYGILH